MDQTLKVLGLFAVPPDGVTILVFFAENGDLNEGYWFAVSQEVPSIVTWRSSR